jgi:hypothetical protein
MSLKTLQEKIISSPYHDLIINGMILSVILLLLSPTIYNSFITEPQNVKELKKRGIIIKAYKNRINHIRRSGVFANYYYFVGGRKYNENLYTRDTPHNYSVPDTLDFFYLSEDPLNFTNRNAYKFQNEMYKKLVAANHQFFFEIRNQVVEALE